MARVVFASPILPGKLEQWLQMCQELTGPRRDAWQASRKRVGLTEESAYLQRTPQGDLAVVLLEGDDIAGAFSKVATSADPFDIWFQEQVKELHGLDLNQLPALPEQYLSLQGS